MKNTRRLVFEGVPSRRLRFSEQVHDLHLVSGAILKTDSELIDNGGKVTVFLSGVSSPPLSEPYDWVGVYCPAGAPGGLCLC